MQKILSSRSLPLRCHIVWHPRAALICTIVRLSCCYRCRVSNTNQTRNSFDMHFFFFHVRTRCMACWVQRYFGGYIVRFGICEVIALSLTEFIRNNKSDSTMIFCRRASITNLMALKTIRTEFNKGQHFSIDAFAYTSRIIWLCLSMWPFRLLMRRKAKNQISYRLPTRCMCT